MATINPTEVHLLRQREHTLAAMIRQVDAKLTRLHQARSERAAALQRIRAELIRTERGSVGTDYHEQR